MTLREFKEVLSSKSSDISIEVCIIDLKTNTKYNPTYEVLWSFKQDTECDDLKIKLITIDTKNIFILLIKNEL